MPSGKTHDLFNIGFLGLIAGAFWLIVEIMELWMTPIWKDSIWIFLGAYLVSTFLLSPDLDLHKNRSKNNWGFLRWLWKPYSKVFSHRGLSHSFIFGVLTRIIYLYSFYFIGLMVYYLFQDNEYIFSNLPFFFLELDPYYDDTANNMVYISVALTGLYIPAILHTVLDHIVSRIKKKRNTRKPKISKKK